MEPEAQERFEKIELRLSDGEEKTIAHDRSLTAIRNLLQTGIRMLVDMEVKMSAIMSAHERLEAKVSAIMDAHERLEGTVQELAEAQKRTEESLRRFLDRSGDGQGT